MATSNQATWKRLFDSVDRTVGSRVNDFARSEDFAGVAAGSPLLQLARRQRRQPAARPDPPTGAGDTGSAQGAGAATTPAAGRSAEVAVGLADPTAVLARLRRDLDRAVIRTRNGLRLLAGVGRPEVGGTPNNVPPHVVLDGIRTMKVTGDLATYAGLLHNLDNSEFLAA